LNKVLDRCAKLSGIGGVNGTEGGWIQPILKLGLAQEKWTAFLA
jgi:hypothetical protein